MSQVRYNLMHERGYAPYCGNGVCMGRAPFDGEQFTCVRCGWRSAFPPDFIVEYKAKWQVAQEPTAQEQK